MVVILLYPHLMSLEFFQTVFVNTNVDLISDTAFFGNVTGSELLEGDTVALSCHLHSYSEVKSNITVELTDNRGRRLTFEEHSLMNQFISVQYNVSVSSSISGPFYCTVTAAVIATETISKTLNVTLNPVLGEFL